MKRWLSGRLLLSVSEGMGWRVEKRQVRQEWRGSMPESRWDNGDFEVEKTSRSDWQV